MSDTNYQKYLSSLSPEKLKAERVFWFSVTNGNTPTLNRWPTWTTRRIGSSRRVEIQLGMLDREEWGGKDDRSQWSCSDDQLDAFAKAHQRKGFDAARELLSVAQKYTKSPAEAIEVLTAELSKRIDAIDAKLAPLIEAERQVAEESAEAQRTWKASQPVETPEAYAQREIASGVIKSDCNNAFASATGWRCECHERHGAEFLNRPCDALLNSTSGQQRRRYASSNVVMEGRVPDPVRAFQDTFSAETVVMDTYFLDKKTS